jgi:uncharacterized membrane protein YidH (DUF202 family)
MSYLDPGLQPQRTSLAWSRTGFAVLINAVVVLRTASNSRHGLLLALGLYLLLASGVLTIYGTTRRAALNTGTKPARPTRLLMISVTTTTLIAAISGMMCIMVV